MLCGFQLIVPKSMADTPEDVSCPPGQSVGSAKQTLMSGALSAAVKAAASAAVLPPATNTSQCRGVANVVKRHSAKAVTNSHGIGSTYNDINRLEQRMITLGQVTRLARGDNTKGFKRRRR